MVSESSAGWNEGTMAKILIRSGTILTMDPALGNMLNADLLIEDGRIAAVGRGLHVPSGEVLDAGRMIVLPGFVNAHLHTWQTGIRGVAGDWSLTEYLAAMHQTLAARFIPEDIYLANLVGALNQINAGATTIFDWCHNNPTPEHTDRGIDGLSEAGIRAVFGHGTPKSKEREGDLPLSHRPHPAAEVQRLRKGRLSSDDALVTMALATLGPDLSVYEVCAADVHLAREYGLLWSAHIGGSFQRLVEDGVYRLAKDGLLGPDFNAVHANQLSDEELRVLADAGASVTSTPEVEMQMGHGKPVIGRLLAAGGRPSLGVDVESNISGDMFTVMRMALQFTRATDNQKILDGRHSPSTVSLSAKQALAWATIDGARALRLDHKIGSLTPGKRADLILIRADDLNLFPVNDALETVVFQASFANVDTVFIDGQAVKKGGKLVYPKLAQKMEALAESGRRILRDVGGASSADGLPR